MRVSELMSSPVLTVGPQTPVRSVARLLVNHRIGGAPVVDEDDRLLGLVTEADLLRLELHPDPVRHLVPVEPPAGAPQHPAATAAELMTTDVYAVPVDADAADVARTMLDQHLTRVPVVDGVRVVGLLSRSDLVRVLVRDDADIAADLRSRLADLPDEWDAHVRDGRVRLEGPTDPEAEALAHRVVWGVPGVIDVAGPAS